MQQGQSADTRLENPHHLCRVSCLDQTLPYSLILQQPGERCQQPHVLLLVSRGCRQEGDDADGLAIYGTEVDAIFRDAHGQNLPANRVHMGVGQSNALAYSSRALFLAANQIGEKLLVVPDGIVVFQNRAQFPNSIEPPRRLESDEDVLFTQNSVPPIPGISCEVGAISLSFRTYPSPELESEKGAKYSFG